MKNKPVYFVMVNHPSGKDIRVGPAYRSRKDTSFALTLVRGLWRPCRVVVVKWHPAFNPDGSMTDAAIKELSERFNMDPPAREKPEVPHG